MYNLNNVHVNRLLQLGKEKGVQHLVMAKMRDGRVEIKGDFNKKEAVKELQKKILEDEALKMNWVRPGQDDFPKLSLEMAELLKKPPKVKSAVAAALNNLMKQSNAKLGRGDFLAWHYPIEKEFMVFTNSLLNSLPNPFTLSMIIDWSDLQSVSIANGRLSALKVASGINTWLGFCKVMLEFCFLVTEHDPATWMEHEENRTSIVVKQRAKRKQLATQENSSTRPMVKKSKFQKPLAKSSGRSTSGNHATSTPASSHRLAIKRIRAAKQSKKDLFNAEDSPITITKSKSKLRPMPKKKNAFEQLIGEYSTDEDELQKHGEVEDNEELACEEDETEDRQTNTR